MLYIDDNLVRLDAIREYQGDDSLMTRLKQNLAKIDHWPVNYYSFKYRPGMTEKDKKSGITETKRGNSFPLTVTMSSDEGSRKVVYCTNVKRKDGMNIYEPRMTTFKKSWIKSKQDKEFVLWFITCAPEYKSGLIVLENLEAEATEVAQQRSVAAGPHFFLYSEFSPIAGDIQKLRKLAMAWGVTGVENMSLDRVKNRLYDAVMLAEKQKRFQYGLKSFNQAVQEENPFLDLLAIVTQAEDKKVLTYDARTHMYLLSDGGKGTVLARLVPSEANKKKETLATILSADKDKLNLLKKAIEARENPDKETEMLGPVDLKGKVVEDEVVNDNKKGGQKKKGSVEFNSETDFKNLKWSLAIKAAKQAGLSMKKKEDLIPELEKFYSDKPPLDE